MDRYEEAFYGGAAGGGKSDALLMAALQWVHVPGYAAIIFRRTFKDLSLPEALIPRSHLWLGPTDAVWHEEATREWTAKTWSFPSGATVSFGYLESDADAERYQSSAYQCICFDEATHFTENQATFVMSRLRRPQRGPLQAVPLRIRLASNPGGRGHDWIKARYVDPGNPNYPFIPARLDDNKHLDRATYIKTLSKLPRVTRLRLLRGDWDARELGGYFERDWFRMITPEELPKRRWRVRYWDLAGTEKKQQRQKKDDPDFCCGTLASVDLEKRGYVEDVRRRRGTPLEIERFIARTAQQDGKGVVIVIEQEPGASGIAIVSHYRRDVLPGFAVVAHPKRESKLDAWTVYSADAEAGSIACVRAPWNAPYFDEIEAAPHVEHDDQTDASAGAYNHAMKLRLRRGDGVAFESEGQESQWRGA